MARRDRDGVVKAGRVVRRREGSLWRMVGVGVERAGRTDFGHPCATPRNKHDLDDNGAFRGCGGTMKMRARAGDIRGIRLADTLN